MESGDEDMIADIKQQKMLHSVKTRLIKQKGLQTNSKVQLEKIY